MLHFEIPTANDKDDATIVACAPEENNMTDAAWRAYRRVTAKKLALYFHQNLDGEFVDDFFNYFEQLSKGVA